MHEDFAADMYIIGTQESTHAKKEWELLLQQTLGPSYVLVETAALGIVYLSFFLRRDLIWFCSCKFLDLLAFVMTVTLMLLLLQGLSVCQEVYRLDCSVKKNVSRFAITTPLAIFFLMNLDYVIIMIEL